MDLSQLVAMSRANLWCLEGSLQVLSQLGQCCKLRIPAASARVAMPFFVCEDILLITFDFSMTEALTWEFQ